MAAVAAAVAGISSAVVLPVLPAFTTFSLCASADQSFSGDSQFARGCAAEEK